jgi:hypothetical protein
MGASRGGEARQQPPPPLDFWNKLKIKKKGNKLNIRTEIKINFYEHYFSILINLERLAQGLIKRITVKIVSKLSGCLPPPAPKEKHEAVPITMNISSLPETLI